MSRVSTRDPVLGDEEGALLIRIDDESLDGDRTGAEGYGSDLAAAERGVHARDELAHAEGLGEVVVGADLERVHLVVLAAARGDHDDRRHDALGASALRHGPAVETRKHQVDNGDVGALEAELAQPALAILRPLDVEPAVTEVRTDRACDDSVVLDQQHRWHSKTRLGTRRRLLGYALGTVWLKSGDETTVRCRKRARMARTLRSVIAAFAVLIVVVLAASGIAVAWFWRERRQVRELLSAEKGQPTEVVLKRMLRQRVHRDELAAVLFSREAVLEATPLPVLILDGEGRVVRVNAAARVALGGVDIGGLAAELAPELGHAISGVLSGPPVDQVEMVAGAERRVWLAHLRSHPDADGRAAVAVLVDVTEDVDFREARRLFSAAVSHELRTPLQRIVGLVDTLALPLSDGERAELVQAAEHEVQRMRELVDEMLLLAALDRGQAALSEGDCDASAVAERVVASRVVRARQSGMTLRIDAAAGLRVPIGEQLLEVVIGNVVDNALKYAGSGAEVEVGVRGRAGEVEIAVSDTGVGIAPEHLPHVFERFFRGEQARSSPGSGLGLAVVKHIVEAHGGRARAESRAGEGAVVRLVLPEASVVSGS